MKYNTRRENFLKAPTDYEPDFWTNVGNQYRFTYLPLTQRLKNISFGGPDPNFVVTDEMIANEPYDLVDDLIKTRSLAEFNYQKNLYKRMSRVKNQISEYGGLGSMLFAGIVDPINLVPLPTAVGMGFVKGATRVGLGAGALTLGIEGVRAPLDPTYDPIETLIAVPASTMFGGLIGGAVGAVTASRVGKDIANATAYDDGIKAKVKEVKVPGMRKPVYEANINPNTRKTLLEEGITPVDEDPNLNVKQFETKLKKTGFGYEATTRLTALGRMLHRFADNLMGNYVTKIFGDMGTISRGVDQGDVAPNSVNLLKGQWNGLSYGYIEDTRNLWLKSKGIKDPRTVASQNVTYTTENIKSKFNKTQSYGEFMREVVLADIRASHKGDTTLRTLKPEIQEAVHLTRKIYKRARDEGIDAKLFNTADNLNFKMDRMSEFAGQRITEIEMLKKSLKNTKRKETTNAKIKNAEEFLDKTLFEMNNLERFAFSLVRAEKGIYDSIDNILAKFDREASQRTSYKDIMESFTKQTKDKEKTLEKLALQIKKTHYDNHSKYLEIFLKLREKFESRGLSDKELAFMENLGKRIEKPTYSKKQKEVLKKLKDIKVDPASGLTKKQQSFYRNVKRVLETPEDINQQATLELLGLMRQSIRGLQKDFKGPREERSYTMRKYMVDTIMDQRESFHKKVIKPYLIKHPAGRLATLIDAKKNGEKIFPEMDEIELSYYHKKEPMPKTFFKRLTTADIDRVEDIMKESDLSRIYMLEDGRYYVYKELQFGKLETRFSGKGVDHPSTPHLLKNSLRKRQVQMEDGKYKLFTVSEIEPSGISNELSYGQMSALIRQVRYVEKLYKGKLPKVEFDKLISAKRAFTRHEQYRADLKRYRDDVANIIKLKPELVNEKGVKRFFKKNPDAKIPSTSGRTFKTKPIKPEQPKVKVGSRQDKFFTSTEILKFANKRFNEQADNPNFYKVTKVSRHEYEGEGAPPTKIEVTDEMIDAQADLQTTQLINRIIGEGDAQDYDGIAGRGNQKFVMHRNFDMPNYLLTKEGNGIADFIDLDGEALMRTYMNKFGPAVEMSRMFNGDRFGDMELYKALDSVMTRHSDEIETNPDQFRKDIFDQKDDIEALLNPILNRAPLGMEVGSASNRIVKLLQQIGQLTMMGMTTIASMADFGKIILSRGIKQSFGRYISAWVKDLNEIDLKDSANKHMMRFIGEGMETLSGTGSTRVAEQSTGLGEINNRVLGKYGDKVFEFFDKMVGGFYNANLLNHWTALNKRLVIPMSVDRIIRTGAMLNNKYTGDKGLLKYKADDIKILRSYGLSETDLKRIHLLHSSKKKGKDIYYSNADEWMETEPELFRKYTSAVRADVLSSIITPTEADKPLMSYGLFKASRWSKSMKDRQHNIFKIPLQFMSWSLAANNKIVLSTLQGRHQGVASGMMAMFALGMISDFARNPDWWRYKSTEEKIMKGIEYSGLTSYLLDINSFAEIASNNFIGIRPNIFGKDNPFTGTLPDQVSEVGGPVGSMIADVYKMAFSDDIEFNDRVNMIKRLIPYNNLFYTKWIFDGVRDSITDDSISLNFN